MVGTEGVKLTSCGFFLDCVRLFRYRIDDGSDANRSKEARDLTTIPEPDPFGALGVGVTSPKNYMHRNLILAGLATVVAARCSLGTPLWTAGTAGEGSLYSVAAGQGLYVTVGPVGAIFTSANGSTWSAASYAGTVNALMAVTYGNGRFVAVGESGWTVTSTDGTHWTSASSGVTVETLRGVMYAAGKFVAVGDNGAIITSTTGTSWALASYAASVPNKTDRLCAVAYGNGHFIAVGVDPNTVFVSATGTLWTQTTGPNDQEHMTGATYGSGLFAVTGQQGIYTSPDGTNWTTQLLGYYELDSIACGNGLFVAAGWNGSIYLSVGGTNCWTAIESDTTNTLYSITFSNGLFVAAGDIGTTLVSSLPGAASVPPKMNWTVARYAPGTPDTSVELTGIATGGSASSFRGFVAVGKSPSTAFVSTNGIQWQESWTGLDSSDPLDAVAFYSNKYIAAGANGGIYSSTSGTNWTTTAQTGASLNGLGAYGGDYFAVGGEGALLHCTAWPSWTSLTSGVLENLYAFGCGMSGAGECVVVGEVGRIITSGNLFQTWTNRASGTSQNLYAIAFGDGRYVAVGEAGAIVTSTNATVWGPAITNYAYAGVDLLGVAYGNGMFVAVGDRGWTAISRDGVNWTWETSATFGGLTGIAYNNGTFVAVDNSGVMILSAAPVLGRAIELPNHSVQVPVTGGPSQVVQIMVSTDLKNWSAYTTITLDNCGSGQFSDPSPTSYSRRFFRAVAE